MPLKNFFWHRQPAIDAALLHHFADSIGPGKLVVDVGAGYDPWPYATEYVDREAWPQLTGKTVHALDVELDRLPYADKSVDFLYCRHTIEDLHNPTLLLREMNRVAKAGYIETPSPIAEFCRGTGGGKFRGHIHHNWFVWSQDSRLHLLPKASAAEHLSIEPFDGGAFEETLASHPAIWNTYFAWRDTALDARMLLHHRDFLLDVDYGDRIALAIVAGIASSEAFIDRIGVSKYEWHGFSPQPA